MRYERDFEKPQILKTPFHHLKPLKKASHTRLLDAHWLLLSNDFGLKHRFLPHDFIALLLQRYRLCVKTGQVRSVCLLDALVNVWYVPRVTARD